MSDSTLLNRLEGLDARYEEIGTLITDPSVIADQRRYVKLTKEYKHLEDLLNAANKYKKLLADIEDAKFLIANESDPDIREMAKEELDANEPQIPKMEEEIKLLLIPEDPEDSKNVVLELRGGTGGDEAAIFGTHVHPLLRTERLVGASVEQQRRRSRWLQRNSDEY